MKYKVGDIVKLRDDLEVYKYDVWLRIKGKPLTITETNCGKVYHQGKFISEGITMQSEGLWEECKGITYEPYEEKTNKYKLIDILNKIANGELKEGTKVIWKGKEGWGDIEYTYKDGDLERNGCCETVYIYEEIFARHLNEEVELIEPDNLPDVGKMAEKIKELDISEMEIENFQDVEFIFTDRACKLNEVIRRINNVR